MPNWFYGAFGLIIGLAMFTYFAPLIQAIAQSALSGRQTVVAAAIAAPPGASCAADPAEGMSVSRCQAADELVVHHLKGATMLIRERSHRGVATGQLVVWGSVNAKGKGKGKGKAVRDSFYELGATKCESVDQKIVDEFLALANAQIAELSKPRTRAAKKSVEASVAVPAEAVPAIAPVAVATPVVNDAVSVEDNGDMGPAVKIKRNPPLYRGVILKMGMMKRIDARNKEFDCYGVMYRTPEGAEAFAWGVDLKTKLREAEADVGDLVEMCKFGQEQTEPGRAPKNLYNVRKLET